MTPSLCYGLQYIARERERAREKLQAILFILSDFLLSVFQIRLKGFLKDFVADDDF